MELKTFTLKDVRSWWPCYDPETVAPEGLTALDVLRSGIPDQDKLWIVLREECIDIRTLRLFSVWCARGALALVANPDARSITACDVAERFAISEASPLELDEAWSAAWDAAWDAAWTERFAAWAAVAAVAAAMDAGWAAREAAREATRAAQVAHLVVMLNTTPDR